MFRDNLPVMSNQWIIYPDVKSKKIDYILKQLYISQSLKNPPPERDDPLLEGKVYYQV